MDAPIPARRLTRLGGLFLLIGSLLVLVLGAHNRLSCDRPSNQCDLSQRRALGLLHTHHRFPLSEIQAVEVRETQGFTSWSAAHHYRLILSTRHLTLEPFANSNQRDTIEARAAEIRTFLTSPAPQLQMEETATAAFAIGFLLMAIGAGFYLSGKARA